VFYVPLLVMWLTVIISYILVIRAVRQKIGEAVRISRTTYESIHNTNSQNLKRDDNAYLTPISLQKASRLNALLSIYPAIFVAVYAFPLTNRIYLEYAEEEMFFLYLMQALTAPLLGFANAVAYGLEKKSLWAKCKKRCCHNQWSNEEQMDHRKDSFSEETITFDNESD